MCFYHSWCGTYSIEKGVCVIGACLVGRQPPWKSVRADDRRVRGFGVHSSVELDWDTDPGVNSLALRCPQCGEPVGWERRVIASVSRATWECPRCVATLCISESRSANAVVLATLIALVLFLIPLPAGRSYREWALGVFLVSAALFCAARFIWMRAVIVTPGFGYCQGCGYDLTGLTGVRCPECGVPFRTG